MSMRLWFVGVLAGVCCLSGGCVRDVSRRGRARIEACYTAYADGDDQAVIDRAGRFLQEHSPSARDDEVYYLRGLALSRRGDPVDARADLTRAAGSQRRAIRAHALLALGDLALMGGDLAGAAALYERSLTEGTARRTPAQHAYVRLGNVLQRQGRWEQADERFSRAMRTFPSTRQARWAAARIGGRAWTVQARAFADRDNARAAARLLVKAKLPATTAAVMRDGKTIHVVRVGRYSRHGQAAETLAAVRRVGKEAYIGVVK